MAVARPSAVLAALLLVTSQASAQPPSRRAFEASVDSLSGQLEIERKLLLEDVDLLEGANQRVANSESSARSAAAEVARAARDPNPSREAVESADRRLGDARGQFRADTDRRDRIADRIADRGRKIALLRSEIARRRSAGPAHADPVTGSWQVSIDPGSRRGVFRLSLDGTIVTGRYALDGGFRGSLRGTFVGEKLTFQRIDSERGLDATFYGRLNAERRLVTGTWEGTNLTPASGPFSGTWSARMIPDDSDDEAP